ncbi:calcium/proton exchanger [Hathewaya histolytica]|uniref:calcium/proton exchanger n=1 Tax=Hathewaya histolytica TaxID=1498 RepID=UPI003B679D69
MRKLNRIEPIILIISMIFLFINTSNNIINMIIISSGIVPLSIIMGHCTDKISEVIGDKKGGFLIATLGNLPELSMGLWAIKYGMVTMAKGALMGCILSNMLLGIGIAIVAGGIKYKEQHFDKNLARTNFIMLFLSLSSMVVLAALNKSGSIQKEIMVSLSIKVSIVLIIIYVLGFIFSFYSNNQTVINKETKKVKNKEYMYSMIILVVSCGLIYLLSENLIGNVNEFIKVYNISEEFIGIILIPLLGNMGELVSAIICATNNKINLSLETVASSSIQMSLFVVPIMVIGSCIIGMQMDLVFSSFQIIMALVAVLMSYIVFQDGKTYWFEGAVLIAMYIMITLAYYHII